MTHFLCTRAAPSPLASRFTSGASSAAFKAVVTGALLIGLIVTSACSGTPAPNATTATPTVAVVNTAQQVTITVGSGMSFEPAAISVHAGQPVELTLRNVGQFPHDFTLSDGVGQPVKIIANGGQNVSGTFTLDKPGTYNFECSMPAHALAGMRGTITAQ